MLELAKKTVKIMGGKCVSIKEEKTRSKIGKNWQPRIFVVTNGTSRKKQKYCGLRQEEKVRRASSSNI